MEQKKQRPKSIAALHTGLKIIGKALLLLPIPVFMVWFNYNIDVSGIFHGEQFEQDIALAMIEGHAVDNYDRMDERGVLAQVANNIEQPYDTLSFGSSRVLQLRTDTVDNGSYFNCGVSSADFVDILGLYYLFDKADQKPDTVILELDPWILSRYSYDRHHLSDNNLYGEFLTERLGRPTEYDPDESDFEKYKALLSPTYFQGNLFFYMEDRESYTPPTIVTDDIYNQKTNLKLSDGSVLYMPSYRNASDFDVMLRAADNAVEFLWMDEFYELDPELCDIFEDYVGYLQDEGIEVVFMLTPYHPLVYHFATENPETYSGFFLTEPYFVEYALEHDIPLYGSYNPFVAGTLEDAFFDGLHMRDDAMSRIFPGMEELERQKEEGAPYSPWVLGRVPVEEEIAERIVTYRYEIPPTEELRQEDDMTIGGDWCYIYGRYEKDDEGEDAVLLAQYAVTKDHGIIYRLDTELDQWVVDKRFP
ncbi:hypothetical protein LJC49_08040 [Ruminococcaceae bacterium OttesenSCG-928-I18]|nr:hypothetical protein [Ruminococcaceae bacterium OttesenSCG-928-I18]